MTNSELSNEFDVLYNNITSNQAPGLNEYEKSVFLTKAQAQLVNEYFNNRTDGFGGGFDGSQKRQYDFSSLTRIANLHNINSFKERITSAEKLDRRSKVFLFPQDYFLAVNEILSDEKSQYSVIPINHTDYQRLMMKPYSFPVKRAAWRIITDKKNCNFVHQDAEGNNIEALSSKVPDYTILTSWADQKRTMKLTITAEYVTDLDAVTDTYFNDTAMVIYSPISGLPIRIICDCGWDDDKLVYEIDITLQSLSNIKEIENDRDIFEILKHGFELLRNSKTPEQFNISEWETVKAATHLDGFQQASAPNKLSTIFEASPNGRTFEFKVVPIPMVEIIGKFNNEPNYQLRYIKTLSPIILEDLDNYGEDISIDGITTKTECELPEETHQEILERAVTLAKIAWQGGTITQASQPRERE